MEQVIVNIKDESKTQAFLDIIQKLDFVEVLSSKKSEGIAQEKEEGYDFFESAGMWRNRNIDAETLRKQAWNRQE